MLSTMKLYIASKNKEFFKNKIIIGHKRLVKIVFKYFI